MLIMTRVNVGSVNNFTAGPLDGFTILFIVNSDLTLHCSCRPKILVVQRCSSPRSLWSPLLSRKAPLSRWKRRGQWSKCTGSGLVGGLRSLICDSHMHFAAESAKKWISEWHDFFGTKAQILSIKTSWVKQVWSNKPGLSDIQQNYLLLPRRGGARGARVWPGSCRSDTLHIVNGRGSLVRRLFSYLVARSAWEALLN